MKKLMILMLLMVFVLKTKAQITMDTTFSNNVTMIKLDKSGFKYMQLSYVTDSIYLYNLDFSLFKQFPIPIINIGNFAIEYITETLFDTDSNDIEFAIAYSSNSPYTSWVKIMDETGATLLDIPNGYFPGTVLPVDLINNTFGSITNTPQGTKMRIPVFNWPSGTFVGLNIYTLPGNLACETCYNPSSNLISGTGNLINQPGYFMSKPIPNPSIQFTRIEYSLPDGVTEGDINLYNISGELIKSFRVNAGSSYLTIPTSAYPGGTYYYSLITKLGKTGGKKMIVIK
jgi:hypothetical protein